MKVLRITTSANTGAISRTAEQLGELVMKEGWESYIAYSRPGNPSSSKLIRVGNWASIAIHLILTRLFDLCGYGSYFATRKLVKKLKVLSPDLIHIHNIHSYDINLRVLFDYLSKANIPVVWTQHDCWAYTGHCSYYTKAKCEKWKTCCYDCSQYRTPPKSLWYDGSRRNFQQKKSLFTSVKNMNLVAVSKWMQGELSQSFLSNYPITLIYNGIDTSIFRPLQEHAAEVREKYNLGAKKILIGVASTWEARKGLDDYVKLNELVRQNYTIVLVGVSDIIKMTLPDNIIGISRTESMNELALLYSASYISLNLSQEESFGKTTPEALACGTPCIVYNSTASPELVDEGTGMVVDAGSIDGVYDAIMKIDNWDRETTINKCRERATSLFSKDENYKKYIYLYKRLMGVQ